MAQVGELFSRAERLFDQASAEKDRAEAAIGGGDPHTADLHYRRCLDLLDQLRAESHDEEEVRRLDGIRADTISRLAMCAHERREYELAREHGEHAVRLYDRAGVRDLAYAVALENLGIAQWNLGDDAMAAVLVRQALAVKRRVCPDDAEQLAFTRAALATFAGRNPPLA